MWQIISLILYLMNLALVFYAAFGLIMRRQDPVKTLSWVVVLILLPYIGLLLYLFLGRNFRKKKIYSRKGAVDYNARERASNRELRLFEKDPNCFGPTGHKYRRMIYLNLKDSHAVMDSNGSVEFYFKGEEALDAMMEAIRAAEYHIHLQSYIFLDDKTGEAFKDLLIEKAQAGVEVRIIVDGFGSRKVKREFWQAMESAGIEVHIFSKVRMWMPSVLMNYRNHRKLLVVDGKVGFLGGVNIADRYRGESALGNWHDTHMRIVGESVRSLQSSFLLDKWFITSTKMQRRKFYFPDTVMVADDLPVEKSQMLAQIVSSGPDSDWSAIMQCIFTAIGFAKRSIKIITPYFAPNETVLNAIKVAALGGVKVTIMLPAMADSKLIHLSTMSYVGELLDAGVDVRLFKAGFNHSKVILIDGEMAIVGSANMDQRSFEQNFEIMSVLYDAACAARIEREFDSLLPKCGIVTKWNWEKRPLTDRFKENIVRLCAPIL